MAKSRKKIFPKKPQALSYLNEHQLNKNSHKYHEAYKVALYDQPSVLMEKPALTSRQEAAIARIKRAKLGQAINQRQDQTMYKFSELSRQAKNIAVLDYIQGWEETHEIGDMSYDDAYSGCLDTEDEVLYDQFGNVYNESTQQD